MTNELEKQFFQCFGIEPKCNNPNGQYCKGKGFNCYYDCKHFAYPPITDRILLKLYCIVSDYCVITADSITELKEKILKDCIRLDVVKVDIKHQVRTLFEEG